MRPSEDQIVKELTELRPETSERFAAELDAWVAEGFPGVEAEVGPSRWSRIKKRLRERPMLPILAGSTAIVTVIAVAVAVSMTSYNDDLGKPLGDSGGAEELSGDADDAVDAGSSGTAEPAPTTVTPDDLTAPSPPIVDEKLKPGQPRVQEKSASMRLSTDADEVDDVADEVVDVVDRYEGIVVASDVSSSGDKGRASFDLRIPTANLQAALADFSDLASVSSRDEGVLDITTPFITAEERYEDAKAEVDSLREQLAEADSTEEVDELRQRLRDARFALVSARNELGSLKERTDYSIVNLTVTGDGDADGWSLGDAIDTAKNVVEDLAGATLIALAVIAPLGAVAFALWFAWTRLQRRRRESSLD